MNEPTASPAVPWSRQAWDAALPAFERILAMPYLAELASGTLPRAKFAFYIQQDALYLADYGRALSGISGLLRDPDEKALFRAFADDAVVCEQQLHEQFIRDFAIPPQPVKSAACRAYADFFSGFVRRGETELALAAILPCFWVYDEVGRAIVSRRTRDGNPYRKWIDTYAGDAFGESVRRCIAVCDAHAAAAPALQSAMADAYVRATEAEYDFWDSAYHLRM